MFASIKRKDRAGNRKLESFSEQLMHDHAAREVIELLRHALRPDQEVG